MPGQDNPEKEGLQAALEFTKFMLAVAGAAIAFLLGSESLKAIVNVWERLLVTAALFSFGVSAIAGTLVLMQGASNIANAEYSLSHRLLRWPGIVNVFGLIFGFLFTTSFVIWTLWWPAPEPPVKPTTVILQQHP